MVYEVVCKRGEVTQKCNGNWAGVMRKIYDFLTEEEAHFAATSLGNLQSEMFFGQEVSQFMTDGGSHYEITVHNIPARESE